MNVEEILESSNLSFIEVLVLVTSDRMENDTIYPRSLEWTAQAGQLPLHESFKRSSEEMDGSLKYLCSFLASPGLHTVWSTFQKCLPTHFKRSDNVLKIVDRTQTKLHYTAF